MKIFKVFLNDIETQLKTKINIYFLLHFGWFLSSILQILTRIKSFSASTSLQEKTENKLQSYNFWNFLLVSVSFNKETVAENRFWKKILAFKKKTKYQRLSVVKSQVSQVAGTAINYKTCLFGFLLRLAVQPNAKSATRADFCTR